MFFLDVIDSIQLPSSQMHLQEALPNILWQHIKGSDDSKISGETTVTQSTFTTPKQI